MESQLLYCYLNYKKNNKTAIVRYSLFERISVIGMLLTIFVLVLQTIWYLKANKTGIRYYLLLLLISILGVTISTFVDHTQIEHASHNMKQYRQNCMALQEWLKTEGFQNTATLSQLHTRLQRRLEILLCESKESKDRLDKWMQTLCIPVILAIIKTYTERTPNLTDATTFVGALLLLFVVVSIFAEFVRQLNRMYQLRDIKQLQHFIDELQTILDIDAAENTDNAYSDDCSSQTSEQQICDKA